MLLAYELLERLRPHALGERRARPDVRRLRLVRAREQLRLPRHLSPSTIRLAAWNRWHGRARKTPGWGVAMARLRTVGLVVRRDRPRAARLARRMITWLGQRRVRVLLDAEATALQGAAPRSKEALAREADLIVVLGGDGTLRSIARHPRPGCPSWASTWASWGSSPRSSSARPCRCSPG
jgi:hypothetical protein